jgi:hypothetical protein
VARLQKTLEERHPDATINVKSVQNMNDILENSSMDISLIPFDDPFGAHSVKKEVNALSSLTEFCWTRVKGNQWMISLDPTQTLSLTKEGEFFYLREIKLINE